MITPMYAKAGDPARSSYSTQGQIATPSVLDMPFGDSWTKNKATQSTQLKEVTLIRNSQNDKGRNKPIVHLFE